MPDLNNYLPAGEPLTYRIDRIEVDHRGDAGLVNLSRLPKDQRAPMWQRIQRERPAQAELIQSDIFQALRQAFDGEVMVEAFDAGEPD